MRRPFSRKSSPLAARSPTSGSVSVRSPACLAKSSKSTSGLDYPSTLVWRDCVKTGLLSFKTEENAAEYDELVTLLRQAEVIRKNAAIAEKKLEQYAEYLQFDE